jgi:iron(III) transport system permease protein
VALAGRGRLDGWALTALAVALLVAVPLLTVPGSLLAPERSAWWRVTRPILADTVLTTALVAGGVAAGTLLLGTGLALLVSFYEFPGRRVLDWALVLPLALPAYVLAFVTVGALDDTGLALRSRAGAIAVLTLALYPYVYLLARAAFRGQPASMIDAARALGVSRLRAIVRVALPVARPALAAGVLLATLETLAEFGAVQLLGVRTFTVSIYQVWFNAFDRQAATQLASLLMLAALALLVLERTARGRARFAAEGSAPAPRARLGGVRGALATATAASVVAVAFAAPVAQLLAWSATSLDTPLVRSEFPLWLRNSVLLAAMAALVAVPAAAAIAYGLRVAPSRLASGAARVASSGYGVPGSVVAVAVLVAFGWAERRLGDLGGLAGVDVGLVFTGTALGLVLAYVVRFLALALGTLESQLERLPRSLDQAARSLGADRLEVLARVHLPLLRPGLAAAALLVFVETMKELPATVLLRPFGGDTLAVGVWQATSESLWEQAALPALALVAVGVLPVVVMLRVLDRTGPPA